MRHQEKIKENKDYSYEIYKKIMKELKINGCSICGYNKTEAALHFHHVVSKGHKHGLSIKRIIKGSNTKIKNELNRCMLLCCNCHNEIHDLDRKNWTRSF
jgi:hypothetical protein